MKSHTQHLTINLPTRLGFLNITPQVTQAVQESGVRLCLVNPNHDPDHLACRRKQG